ncbi:L,D-transpeptidase family protein [Sulfurimonas sp. HSL-1716]|uniref:L,D-transpeptidase family protein n=1 Tax=Hydrocurvibacter sulfurireducens TaxID=3131937 RepID=UPI0031F75BC9
MIKIFLIFILLQFNILHARQILLVVSENFNSTKAKLYTFEDSKSVFRGIDVNIGRNGLAWDGDDKYFHHDKKEPLKREGDGKSPAGVFLLKSSFGYEDNDFLLPYIKSTTEKICVDDADSDFYNRIIDMPKEQPKSFENMKRDDIQYKIGVVVDYNPNKVKNRGSCIFLHVQKEKDHPTAGCTSMRYEDLRKILKWLDPNKKPLLIQIPKNYIKEIPKELLSTDAISFKKL